MKIELQNVSLLLSKKLKRLGVPQFGLFWWGEYVNENQFKGNKKICTDLHTSDKVNYKKIASAFTVAELGEILPDNCISSGKDSNTDKKKPWGCVYTLGRDLLSARLDYVTVWASTEANARAKMLIHLIENGRIKP